MAASEVTGGGSRPAAASEEFSARDRGIGELVKDLASQTSTLVRQEIQLAQAEVTEKGKLAGRAPACSPARPCSGCSPSAPSPRR